jgi:hypothetical protein
VLTVGDSELSVGDDENALLHADSGSHVEGGGVVLTQHSKPGVQVARGFTCHKV